MGAVYEAVDERLGAWVALKESFASEVELRKQFEREARLLASLRHPALPRVTDYFIEDEHSYLVMEYLPGPTLANVLSLQEGRPFKPSQVIRWADQVLDVLVYLHGQDRGIVHRDIKPHNLKLTEAGGICLIDFGLAKSRSDEGRSVHGFTRRYAPLEQIEDRGTTERSDIYALGATLYHLLTGVKPADAAVRARATAAGGEDPLRSGHVLLPAIGVELSSILDRALALQPEDRFASAAEFRAALGKIGRVEDSGYGMAVSFLARPWSRIAAGLLILISLGLLMIVGGVWKREERIASSVAVAGLGADSSSEAEGSGKKSSSAPKSRSPVQRVARVNNPIEGPKVSPLKAAHVRIEVAKSPEKSLGQRRNPSRLLVVTRPVAARNDEVLRAPDGTEVVKFRDGRVRAFQAGERRQ